MDKLGNQQTKDRIADMLRTEILSGRLEDGQELTQEQLAQLLEVSRMPIREALQILEMEGLLLRLPNRHMRVVGLNERTVFDNMRAVAAVEAEIALILMEDGILPDEAGIQNDQQFHNWFSQRLGNAYLFQTHRRLLNIYPQYIWETCKKDSQLTKQNENIRLALVNGNADAVREHIHRYYQDLAQLLLSHMKEGYYE